MLRVILGLLIGGGLGLAASQVAVSELFERDLTELFAELQARSGGFGALIALPILFLLLRGVVGFLVSTALIAGVAAVAIKLYLDQDMPIEQVAVMTGVFALVATAIYQLLVRRVIG